MVRLIIAISYADFPINPLCSRYFTVNDINGMRQSNKCCSAFIQVVTDSSKRREKLSNEMMNQLNNNAHQYHYGRIINRLRLNSEQQKSFQNLCPSLQIVD